MGSAVIDKVEQLVRAARKPPFYRLTSRALLSIASEDAILAGVVIHYGTSWLIFRDALSVFLLWLHVSLWVSIALGQRLLRVRRIR